MPSPNEERLFLLDTNAYLRIADCFYPLISTVFGDPPCKLRVVPDLDRELKRSPRLTSKFHWASSERYAEDRRRYIRVSPDKRAEIETNLEYIMETANDLRISTSPVDNFCLAYALALGATVITDDGPMTSLAAEFEITVINIIDFLKFMHDQGRASLQEIRDAFWSGGISNPLEVIEQITYLPPLHPQARRHRNPCAGACAISYDSSRRSSER